MHCKYHKKIEAYHHGMLKEQVSEQIRAHLQECRDCSGYLAELKTTDQIIEKVKDFSPVLQNPGTFKNEILSKIEKRKKRNVSNTVFLWIDKLIYALVHPVTRYSFISAAVIIFGVFIYQQTIIVQKIGSLEKRMETSVKSDDTRLNDKKSQPGRLTGIEALIKKRPGSTAGDVEFNELLEDYQLLLLKHKILLRSLRKKYPETYQEIIRELEKAKLLPENVNI